MKPVISIGNQDFRSIRESDTAIWSLLLASGYLKPVESHFQEATGKTMYHLKITNQETLEPKNKTSNAYIFAFKGKEVLIGSDK